MEHTKLVHQGKAYPKPLIVIFTTCRQVKENIKKYDPISSPAVVIQSRILSPQTSTSKMADKFFFVGGGGEEVSHKSNYLDSL